MLKDTLMNPGTLSGTEPAEKLSAIVGRLKTQAEEGQLTVGQFLHYLSLNGHMFVCFVFAVPFLIPMPLPGVSTPLGLAIAAAGIQIVAGRDPWLPASWARRALPKPLALKILATVSAVLKVTEKLVSPRMRFFARHPGFARFNGFVIFVIAILLAMPMPPGFNAPPALAIILLSLGSLEKDGVAIIAGYALSLLNLVMFGAVFVLGISGVKSLIGWDG